MTHAKHDIELIGTLTARIEALERLCACPRCKGSGTVETRDEPDECPDCHGTKINAVLLPH